MNKTPSWRHGLLTGVIALFIVAVGAFFLFSVRSGEPALILPDSDVSTQGHDTSGPQNPFQSGRYRP